MLPIYYKIDIHTHMNKEEGAAEKRLFANKILGFSKCVLMTATDSPEFKRMGEPFLPEDAIELVRRYPENFAWMCNLIPDGTDATYEKLKKYKEMGAAGMGEFATRYRFDDPRVDHLFSCLQELKLPFLFHMAPVDAGRHYGIVDDPRLPGLERALAKFPDLIFIGHSQPFWFEIAKTDETDPEVRNTAPYGKIEEGRIFELMRKYPNLYCDLSANSGTTAILRDQEHGLRFLEEFQDRLFFGSDWIVGMPYIFALSTWMDFMHMKGQLSHEAYEKISSKNAERLFFK